MLILSNIELGKLPNVEVGSITSLSKDIKEGYPYYVHASTFGIYLPYYANNTRRGIYIRGKITSPPIIGLTKLSIVEILNKKVDKILPPNVWSSDEETHVIIDVLRNKVFLTSKNELNFFYKMLMFYNNLPVVDLAIVGGLRIWFITSTNRIHKKGKKYVYDNGNKL